VTQVYILRPVPRKKMNFQQVALVALSFSSAKGGSIERSPLVGSVHQISIIPPLGLSRFVIEQDNQVPDSWYVRVVKGGHRRRLEPPHYFPAVTTVEGLQETLKKAWDFHRQTSPPAPFLTRFFDHTSRASSPTRTASPQHQQTGSSRQNSPRPV
jgi:hypothetical protein